MKNKIVFRKANLKDWDAVSKLRQQLAHDPTEKWATEYAPFSPERDHAWIGRCLRAKNKVILVAEDGEKVLAHSIILIEKASPKMRPYYTYDVKALLVHLYVDENYRRQKIGSNLMKYSLKYLKQRGVEFVDLDCYPKNTGAMALYKKMGFKDIWIKKRFTL